MTRHRQYLAFVAFLVLLAAPLSARLWAIRDLYLSADARRTAELVMRSLEERRGWLLSDIHLSRASWGSLELAYKPHHRGWDTKSTCFVVINQSFDGKNFDEIPCDAD